MSELRSLLPLIDLIGYPREALLQAVARLGARREHLKQLALLDAAQIEALLDVLRADRLSHVLRASHKSHCPIIHMYYVLIFVRGGAQVYSVSIDVIEGE